MMIFSVFLVAGLMSTPQANPMQIIATTPDLADVVRHIGGDEVEVQLLIPGAVDPHKVIPKASMLLKLKRADALVSMGLGFEHAFLPALLEKVGQDDFGRGASDVSQGGRRHLVGSAFIGRPLEVPTQLDRGGGVDVHPLGNPHWNTNPQLMRKFAVGAREFLSRLRPASAGVFSENWKKWDVEIERLIEHWQAWLAPARGKSLVTYHRSWPYFADAFGLVISGEVEPKPGMSPTTRHLAQLTQSMIESGVQLLLLEPWFSESKLGNLPKMTKVSVIKIASMSGKEGYLAWMGQLVSQAASVWDLAEPRVVKQEETSEKRSVD
jgi:zinc/manganese transport system substrate-binding protein